jgi:hypothetical protein
MTRMLHFSKALSGTTQDVFQCLRCETFEWVKEHNCENVMSGTGP